MARWALTLALLGRLASAVILPDYCHLDTWKDDPLRAAMRIRGVKCYVISACKAELAAPATTTVTDTVVSTLSPTGALIDGTTTVSVAITSTASVPAATLTADRTVATRTLTTIVSTATVVSIVSKFVTKTETVFVSPTVDTVVATFTDGTTTLLSTDTITSTSTQVATLLIPIATLTDTVFSSTETIFSTVVQTETRVTGVDTVDITTITGTELDTRTVGQTLITGTETSAQTETTTVLKTTTATSLVTIVTAIQGATTTLTSTLFLKKRAVATSEPDKKAQWINEYGHDHFKSVCQCLGYTRPAGESAVTVRATAYATTTLPASTQRATATQTVFFTVPGDQATDTRIESRTATELDSQIATDLQTQSTVISTDVTETVTSGQTATATQNVLLTTVVRDFVTVVQGVTSTFSSGVTLTTTIGLIATTTAVTTATATVGVGSTTTVVVGAATTVPTTVTSVTQVASVFSTTVVVTSEIIVATTTITLTAGIVSTSTATALAVQTCGPPVQNGGFENNKQRWTNGGNKQIGWSVVAGGSRGSAKKFYSDPMTKNQLVEIYQDFTTCAGVTYNCQYDWYYTNYYEYVAREYNPDGSLRSQTTYVPYIHVYIQSKDDATNYYIVDNSIPGDQTLGQWKTSYFSFTSSGRDDLYFDAASPQSPRDDGTGNPFGQNFLALDNIVCRAVAP